jgi:Methyltransferase domain
MDITLDYEFRPFPRYGYGKGPHRALYALIDKRRAAFEQWLRSFGAFRDDLRDIPFDADPALPEKPYWNNGFFLGLDAISLHCMLCIERPKIFCEIGSGHSTRFARNAIRRHDLQTQIISIDPEPRSDVDAICDVVVREPVEDLGPEYFDCLESGDFLFIDSSHRSFMNSDVTTFYLDVLPNLRRGVFIHSHDIFLPYDYPAAWSDRFYNEQYLLACVLLTGHSAYEILLANTFITEDRYLNPVMVELCDHLAIVDMAQYGWSFWMRKV